MATIQQQWQQWRQQRVAYQQQYGVSQPLLTTSQLGTLITQIAAVLGARMATAPAVVAIAALLSPFTVTAVTYLAIGLAYGILEKYPLPRLEGVGAAQRYVIRVNEIRRASFLLNSIDRIQRALAIEMAQGASPAEASDTVRTLEERYFGQHVSASAGRMDAASNIDALQSRYGDILGWYAQNDARATAECRAASGKNFSALTPPLIGWPGMVHVNCRCRPGPPHRKAVMLP